MREMPRSTDPGPNEGGVGGGERGVRFEVGADRIDREGSGAQRRARLRRASAARRARRLPFGSPESPINPEPGSPRLKKTGGDSTPVTVRVIWATPHPSGSIIPQG
jgi:hypothetical protein